MKLLIDNNLTNVTDTLLRTFLEQSVYLEYIFQENSEKRAELLYFYEKMNSHVKALNIVNKLSDKKLADNIKQTIDKQIKNDPSERKSLNESTKYFKHRYNCLFPKNTSSKIRRHWYNAEPPFKNNSFNQLCKSLKVKDLYLGMYAPYSDNTHGVNGVSNFIIRDSKGDKHSFNLLIETYDKSYVITLLESELNVMFMRLASYYKIDGANSWARTIYMKIGCNVLLKRNHKIQTILRKKGIHTKE